MTRYAILYRDPAFPNDGWGSYTFFMWGTAFITTEDFYYVLEKYYWLLGSGFRNHVRLIAITL